MQARLGSRQHERVQLIRRRVLGPLAQLWHEQDVAREQGGGVLAASLAQAGVVGVVPDRGWQQPVLGGDALDAITLNDFVLWHVCLPRVSGSQHSRTNFACGDLPR